MIIDLPPTFTGAGDLFQLITPNDFQEESLPKVSQLLILGKITLEMAANQYTYLLKKLGIKMVLKPI